MKKRTWVIILLVAAVGAVAWWVVARYGSSGTIEQDYHIDSPTKVTKIFLSDKQSNHTTLSRTASGESGTAWMVDDLYPANEANVELLLETLTKMRIREQVNKTAIPGLLKRMAAKSVKVEVYGDKPLINWFGGRLRMFTKERLLTTYFVGSETQDMLGTYMFREGDKVPYVIHIPGFRGFISPRFPTDPYAWRSHRIVSLAPQAIGSVELEITSDSSQSFAIVRQGEGFKFELLHPRREVMGFDTLKVAQFLSSFVNLNFDEYARAVPNTNMDSTIIGTPRTVLTIVDTAGAVSSVRAYLKYINPDDLRAMPDTTMYNIFDLNRMYAVVNNADTVLIQYYVFDNILQPASFFIGGLKQ